MIIESRAWTIGELLTGKYFRIPSYQRPYSWEKSHLEDFWGDTIKSRENDSYFLGSLVASKGKSDAAYAVVDGQQRLTTITIFLCALRNTFAKEGFPGLANGLHNFIERKDKDDVNQHVLQTATSYPFFQEFIQKREEAEVKEDVGPEEVALKVAADFFQNKLAEVVDAVRSNSAQDAKQQESTLRRELLAIREQLLSLRVILIELENEDDAFLVFETLNTRGKDLKATDLVKNLILRHKKPKTRGVDIAKDKWNKLIETLEESDVTIRTDAFLHHYWLSRHDFVAQRQLYKAMRQVVRDGKSASDLLESLCDDAEHYRTLHEPQYRSQWIQQELSVKASLEAINQFGVRLSLPLVLSIVRDWEGGGMKLSMARDTLRQIENFHFLFNAVTEMRATGGLAMMFASLAKKLTKASPVKKSAICREVRQKLRERVPARDAFILAFKKIYFTKQHTRHKALVRYILSRVAEEEGHAQDPNILTIEHFLPQSTQAVPSEVVGQLGNLFLVTPEVNNAKLRDKAPNLKLNVLKKGKHYFPDAMDTPTWGTAEIAAQTDALAARCNDKIFRV